MNPNNLKEFGRRMLAIRRGQSYAQFRNLILNEIEINKLLKKLLFIYLEIRNERKRMVRPAAREAVKRARRNLTGDYYTSVLNTSRLGRGSARLRKLDQDFLILKNYIARRMAGKGASEATIENYRSIVMNRAFNTLTAVPLYTKAGRPKFAPEKWHMSLFNRTEQEPRNYVRQQLLGQTPTTKLNTPQERAYVKALKNIVERRFESAKKRFLIKKRRVPYHTGLKSVIGELTNLKWAPRPGLNIRHEQLYNPLKPSAIKKIQQEIKNNANLQRVALTAPKKRNNFATYNAYMNYLRTLPKNKARRPGSIVIKSPPRSPARKSPRSPARANGGGGPRNQRPNESNENYKRYKERGKWSVR
jgi:hypothetical protein